MPKSINGKSNPFAFKLPPFLHLIQDMNTSSWANCKHLEKLGNGLGSHLINLDMAVDVRVSHFLSSFDMSCLSLLFASTPGIDSLQIDCRRFVNLCGPTMGQGLPTKDALDLEIPAC